MATQSGTKLAAHLHWLSTMDWFIAHKTLATELATLCRNLVSFGPVTPETIRIIYVPV